MGRTGRTALRGLTTAAALCAVAALPGAVAAGPAEPPGYETAPDAEPVRGATSGAEAPELAPGVYTDSIGPGEERLYAVELDAASTAYLSAMAAPAPGTAVAVRGDGLALRLTTAEGKECDTARVTFAGNGTAYPIGDHTARRTGGRVDARCRKAGRYLFSVGRVGGEAGGEWPLEIRHMSEPGLAGETPQPPAEGAGSTEPPEPSGPPGGEVRPADGGSGPNDAAALRSGAWRDRLRPGETRFYRVPLEWGQRLFAAAELPAVRGRYAFVPGALGLQLYNPARGAVVGGNFKPYDGKMTTASLGTPPVDYGNRYGTGADEVSVPGWYYLELTLHRDLERFFPDGAGVTLRVNVDGEAAEGPEYAGDLRAAGFGTDDDGQAPLGRGRAEQGRPAADARRDGHMLLLAWAGIGTGGALLLGLGLWTVAARRGGGTGTTGGGRHAAPSR
ncbi:hypothetical protein V1L54_08770 [Streptomyces sp. TRM 70361]|uniref:hypothetical protein n=1 Tax=Streptomyces sp. TRM 70361 TaxID=3116553 RepID=UPI002E7BEEE3|nr:hypothetical protein [Streptomyces sp. TRM 70361]MEE1939507.1 hypothetical protein [Streptomyces sp. TRM 70361]